MCHARALICCQSSCYYTHLPPHPPTPRQTVLPHHHSQAVKISKYFVCDWEERVSAGWSGAAPRGRPRNLACSHDGSLLRPTLAVIPSQGRLRVVGWWRTTPASGAQGCVKHQENTKGGGGFWGWTGNWVASHCSAHLYPACMLSHIVFSVLIMRCRLGCLGLSCN